MIDWEMRRKYIQALGDLKNEISREMDRAQQGTELQRRGSHLQTLMSEAEGWRIRLVREQEIEYEEVHGDPGCASGEPQPKLRAF